MERILALLLVCLVLMVAVDSTAITRDEVWDNAISYRDQVWLCSENNTIVDCDDNWVCNFVAGETYTGVAYDWGGYDTITEFDTYLEAGCGAGSKASDLISACTTGVDCSGFVSRAWEMDRYYTSNIGEICLELAEWAKIKRGDFANYAGHHVRLCEEYSGVGTMSMIEASNSAHIVRDIELYPDAMSGYIPLRIADYIDPSPGFVDIQYNSGILTWRGFHESDDASPVDVSVSYGVDSQFVQHGSGYEYRSGAVHLPGGDIKYVSLTAEVDGQPVVEVIDVEALCATSPISTSHVDASGNNDNEDKQFEPARVNGAVMVLAPRRWELTVNMLRDLYEYELGYTYKQILINEGWSYWGPNQDYDNAVAGIKQCIELAYNNDGVRYFVIVGDYVRRFNTVYGRERDIIPSVEIDPGDPSGPISDHPYADLNDDGHYDLVVTRIPVATEAEFRHYVNGLNDYCANPIVDSSYRVVLSGDNVLPPNREDERLMVNDVCRVVKEGLMGATVYSAMGDQLSALGYTSLHEAVVSATNSYSPSLLCLYSYMSQANDWGHAIQDNNYLDIVDYPIVLAPICYTGRFSHNKTLVDLMMTKSTGSAAPVVVAATVNTKAVGNRAFFRVLLELYQQDRTAPFGDLYYGALNEMRVRYEGIPPILYSPGQCQVLPPLGQSPASIRNKDNSVDKSIHRSTSSLRRL